MSSYFFLFFFLLVIDTQSLLPCSFVFLFLLFSFVAASWINRCLKISTILSLNFISCLWAPMQVFTNMQPQYTFIQPEPPLPLIFFLPQDEFLVPQSFSSKKCFLFIFFQSLSASKFSSVWCYDIPNILVIELQGNYTEQGYNITFNHSSVWCKIIT